MNRRRASRSEGANPATLIPLSPEDSAPLYVEMMGGAEKILDKGQQLYDTGSAKAKGDMTAIERLLSYQIDFDLRFQMVPGAGEPPKVTPTANPFER